MALAAGAALLVISFAVYWVPALPYLDDDVCITSVHTPGREPASGGSDWSWWPVGVECRWSFPDDRQPRRFFEGPSPSLRWWALGLASGALLITATGVLVAVRDLRT